MEAVRPVSTTIRYVVVVNQFLMPCLIVAPPYLKNRVFVSEGTDDFTRINPACVVERHAVGLLAVQSLENVHVVRHGGLFVFPTSNVVVPARPRFSSSGQNAVVRV